jgi:ribosomal protein S16
MVDPPAVSLKRERASEWLKQGAQPSEAVSRILTREGILEGALADRVGRLNSSPKVAEATAPVAISGEAAVGSAPNEAPEE